MAELPWHQARRSRADVWQFINHGLKVKYQDEMYCICSPVVNIIDKTKSVDYIKFVEDCHLQEKTESLTKYYRKTHYENKIKELTTFYKFHQEVPRLFMKDKCVVIHYYYDAKRRINYERIRRLLELEMDPGDVNHTSNLEIIREDAPSPKKKGGTKRTYTELCDVLLTDSLIEHELNHHFNPSPGKKSNSTIHEINSKLEEVFKSTDMKKKSITLNNDSTTLCSRKILGHQDKNKHLLYSSQQSKKGQLSGDEYLKPLVGSTTSVQLEFGTLSKPKVSFKKKKTKRTVLDLGDKDLRLSSMSKKKKGLASLPLKQPSIGKKGFPPQDKKGLLIKLFKQLQNGDTNAKVNGKVSLNLREKRPTGVELPKQAVFNLGEPGAGLHKEPKRNKLQKKSMLNVKRKSYDMSIKAMCQNPQGKPIFDKRRSEVAKSIDSNHSRSKQLQSSDIFALERRKKASPQKLIPTDHSIVTALQSSVQSSPEHLEVIFANRRRAKCADVEFLDLQSRKHSKEFSNVEKFERLLAKKKSEPTTSNVKQGIFEFKKKSSDLSKPLHFSHKAVLNCITELNSNRRTLTKDCIKNMIQKKKSDQSATVFFRKKTAKGNNSKVRAKCNETELQLSQIEKFCLPQSSKARRESEISQTVHIADFAKSPHKRKSSKAIAKAQQSADASSLIPRGKLHYSIQHCWQPQVKDDKLRIRDSQESRSLKASFSKGPFHHAEIIDLRKSKPMPYIVFDKPDRGRQF